MGAYTDMDDMAFHSNIPPVADFAVAIVYAVFGICSLLGNSILLYVSYKKKHQLKPAEFFIINLAFSDMGLTLALYPLAIISSIYHRWMFGKTVCLIYAFCGMLFGLCSLTTLTLLSMVCFVKVCYPLYVRFRVSHSDQGTCYFIKPTLHINHPIHQGNRFNQVHGRLLIACAWAYALVFACSPLAHWGEYGPEPYGTACCIDWRLSNLHPVARSYTAALFVFCYILPCCVILASYTGILMMVRASHKAMEHHVARPIKLSNIQAVIVKLSVAVCIGFFTAWSPYAVVSMWAAFGQNENIPPLAFALPAMFAKSSTIYNPIIYLMLRPNFRRVMYRDLESLRRACLKGCLCFSPLARIDIHSLRRRPRHNQSCTITLSPRQALAGSRGCSGGCDVFECFSHYPRGCCGDTSIKAPQGQPSVEPRRRRRTPTRKPRRQLTRQEAFHKKSLRVTIRGKHTSEIDNFQRELEMVPGYAKVAWP
ncbi:opsin-5-like [Esox lucius]|uniref:G-protein coupled receptors family 1 profile domain-containing protein n=1 Tax=Esox lucius TaxID=8010 RepID=A0A3P9AEI4_ESOLU|nr:opsin-5-like [Esox lucius]